MKQIALETIENLEPWVQRIVDNLPTGRRRHVLDFLEHLKDDGVSSATLQNYVSAIGSLNGGKPYTKLTEADIREWAQEIDAKHTPKTAWLYRLGIRKLLKFCHTGKLDGDGYPPCVAWMKNHRAKRNFGRDILTQEEVRRIVDAATDYRDKALLFVLYESGCRASELLNLRIRDIEFDSYGTVIRVGRGEGAKTGERRVRIFHATPDLRQWLEKHPTKSPDGFLWPSRENKDKPIHRRTLLGLTKKYAKMAGIEKKISPHIFRHSRASHFGSKLKEPVMREFFGWAKDSDMPATYVHLSGRDVDDALFELYGLQPHEDEPRESPLKMQVCLRCKAENSATARFCWRCWIAFDAHKADEITAKVIEELIKRAPELLQQIVKERGLDREIAELAQAGEKQAV